MTTDLLTKPAPAPYDHAPVKKVVARQPARSYTTLRAVAVVLADIADGFVGKEIANCLLCLGMANLLPTAKKRDRLTAEFLGRQNQDSTSRCFITFIVHVTEFVGYRDRPELFALRQDPINERLTFVEQHVNDRSHLALGVRLKPLDEATRIATAIREELQRRKTRSEVLR